MYLCPECIKNHIGVENLRNTLRITETGWCDKCGSGNDAHIKLLSVLNHTINNKSFFYDMFYKPLEVTPDDFQQYHNYPENPTRIDQKQKKSD